MRKYVLDASVAVKWFFPHEESSQIARRLLRKIKEKRIKVLIPQLFFFEVINVIKTKTRSTAEDVLQVVDDIFSLNLISQKISKELLVKANFYAQKYDLTIYDTSYIGLAEINKVILVTADQKLAKKVNLKFVKTLEKLGRF